MMRDDDNDSVERSKLCAGFSAVVVEDDPAILKLTVRALDDLGVSCCSFCDAESAISYRYCWRRLRAFGHFVPLSERSLALALRASDFVPHDAAPAVLARALTRGAHGRNGFSQQAPGGFDEVTAERPLPRNADFLVVDDDPAITRLIRRILEGRYAVHVENGGQAAIDACKTHAFRAVSCDLRMPDVSGADVFRAISERDPALARRVVFVTAHELDAAEAEFFMGLNNTLIRKPFAIRDILGAAARVLGEN
jgi:CheY-like chemotaxis protein